MSSVETNINSYDAGRKPYNHDKMRGKWEGQWDFYLSCIGHAFGIKNFVFLVGYFQFHGGFMLLVPVIINLLIFIVPIFFVQSFLGQFSSTGYLTVFRISPLFKGIGYVILALNFTSILYYSSVATYPLLFFFKSFTLNTTWMYCDNSWNSEDCYLVSNETNSTLDSVEPVSEYYLYEVLKLSHIAESFHMSWTLIVGGLFLWIIVAICIFNGIEMMGRILRYTTLVSFTLLLILFIRVLFLPEAGTHTANFFKPELKTLWNPISWILSPLLASITLGNGWGSTLTLASYQPFKKNTEKYSYIIPFAITAITFITTFTTYLIDNFIAERAEFSLHYFDEFGFEYSFVGIAYFFGKIEASQMWSMIFYLLLFLFELNSIIVQTFSIVTAICDEYEHLREYRKKISIGLCAICYLLSCLFATSVMINAYKPLTVTSSFVQMLICFLEIMIVVWVYGRISFLRDVQFMLSKKFDVWKFYIIRFVTPAFIFLTGAIYLLTTVFYVYHDELFISIIITFVKGLPWICIPAYVIAKMVLNTGTFFERLKKCTRPNDWYPAHPVEKQKYELALGTSDISQQLLEMESHEVP